MKMNAWWVAKELANPIDGAPVFNKYIHSFVTEKPSDTFFFNRKNLTEKVEMLVKKFLDTSVQ